MSQGYFRFPAVCQNKIAFISEDDLWEVGLEGGAARRLTAGRGSFSRPLYSPGGRWLAFASAEEGYQEVYIMPAGGGDLRRLTYLGSSSYPAAWLGEDVILFRSPAFEPHREPTICRVSIGGGLPVSLRLGPAVNIAVSDAGQVLLERNSSTLDPAHWKRYRGGMVGRFWIAPSLDSVFRPLIELDGNLSRPLWVGERIYFVSDHEGVGALFSCTDEGADLRRETPHTDFYVRNPSTDGASIVYHAGGDLYVFDIAERRTRKLAIEYRGQRTQRQRRVIPASDEIDSFGLDAKGERTVLSIRGQIHQMRNRGGPVSCRNEPGRRLRLARFLSDGRRVVSVCDEDHGEDRFEIWDASDGSIRPVCPAEAAGRDGEEPGGGWGRVVALEPSPMDDRIAFANHRNELWTLDLRTGASRRLSVSAHQPTGRFAWSPDGRWLAFPHSDSPERQHLRIADARTGESRPVTRALFKDYEPSFDPEGRHLYFLSDRNLDPAGDSVQFGYAFTVTAIPCLITLRRDAPSPFLEAESDEEPGKGGDARAEGGNSREADGGEVAVDIDFDGIEERILAFPGEGAARYTQIVGLKKKVMWLWRNQLEVYDFGTLSSKILMNGVKAFSVSRDRKRMLLRRTSGGLLALKAGEQAGSDDQRPGRDSGALDLDRLTVVIEPAAEWRQMLYEAWRLQRDHFWREDMAKVDWAGVLERYVPLVARVNCRSEFDDLLWEMQGELGASHAYANGGDYRDEPCFPVGFLGADFAFDGEAGGYRIERLLRGDPWRRNEACPLRAPGVTLDVGDVVTAVNGRKLDAQMTPHQALLHQADAEVLVSARRAGGAAQTFRVRTLRSELRARYRDWVENARAHVDEATGGRVGYVHIPDMKTDGFAEFHRHFLRDYDRDGLIIDIRHNRGGYVSQLLLEKLCRQRLGFRGTRWFGALPYPPESPAGPMVALINEHAASDGDIFAHAFRLRKMGPLIGRRTWGGVIGFSPGRSLVDGGMTSQPEFSTWFKDVGWKVENRGVDPDIDVDILPHDHRRGVDAQLDRGVEEILKRIETNPPFRPAYDELLRAGES